MCRTVPISVAVGAAQEGTLWRSAVIVSASWKSVLTRPLMPMSGRASLQSVITCVVEYVIDPAKIDAFERFAERWMELVNLHGGTHHGYFLPAEGASDNALALFSFPSLAAYEQYRALFGKDPEFVAADRIRDESGCVLRYQRTFMRPLLPGQVTRGEAT
jgi:hypothetical protein